MKNIITIEEFSNGYDHTVTQFKSNGTIIGSFSATPKNLGETSWEVEMAYWEEGQIEIIDVFKNIEGSYKKYLKNYIDKFIYLINIAHNSDKGVYEKVDKLAETLKKRRHALLNNDKKRYYSISKMTQKRSTTFYSVQPTE